MYKDGMSVSEGTCYFYASATYLYTDSGATHVYSHTYSDPAHVYPYFYTDAHTHCYSNSYRSVRLH